MIIALCLAVIILLTVIVTVLLRRLPQTSQSGFPADWRNRKDG